jgi:hypothetical protein
MNTNNVLMIGMSENIVRGFLYLHARFMLKKKKNFFVRKLNEISLLDFKYSNNF